jgi:shikimate dehydrogenase
MIDISGTTRVFPVIGYPVEQVKAPALFNAYFKRHDIDARVVPLKIAPSRYREAVRTFADAENVGGLFVSIPHKPMTVDAVDEVAPRAALAGSCNAVVYRRGDDSSGGGKGRIFGDLIDGEGFVRALDRTCQDAPFDWRNSRALVAGANGGVGRAIVTALLMRGIGEVALYDVREDQLQEFRARLASAFPQASIILGKPEARGFDLAVNGTPLGMHPGDPMPISLDGILPGAVVADCGMKTENTALLMRAEELGCRIQKGKEMLIEQAPLYLELFGWPGVQSDEFRELGAL